MDHRIPKINIGFFGLVKDETWVTSIFPEIEATAQEQVEEIAVLVEAETQEPGVDMLELVDGAEALKEAGLDL